jgi:hypothetical protein
MRDVEAERLTFRIAFDLPTVFHETLRVLAVEADRSIPWIARAILAEALPSALPVVPTRDRR